MMGAQIICCLMLICLLLSGFFLGTEHKGSEIRLETDLSDQKEKPVFLKAGKEPKDRPGISRVMETPSGKIEIMWVKDFTILTAAEREDLLQQGYIPIEMADGDESWVSQYILDHHGVYRHFPPACEQALKHAGVGKKIIVNHVDLDCVLAGLIILGGIPSGFNDLENLVASVSRLDRSPIGADVAALPHGNLIQSWKYQLKCGGESNQGLDGWFRGAMLLIGFLSEAPEYIGLLKDVVPKERSMRVKIAREDMADSIKGKFGVVMIPGARVWGYDVQFTLGEDGRYSPQCIVARSLGSGRVSISCPTDEDAKELFGAEGVFGVCAWLNERNIPGWGGGIQVGGSPRSGKKYGEYEMPQILNLVESFIRMKNKVAA